MRCHTVDIYIDVISTSHISTAWLCNLHSDAHGVTCFSAISCWIRLVWNVLPLCVGFMAHAKLCSRHKVYATHSLAKSSVLIGLTHRVRASIVWHCENLSRPIQPMLHAMLQITAASSRALCTPAQRVLTTSRSPSST